MPELPEVEITRRGIAPYLVNQTVHHVTIRNPKLRWPIPQDLPQLLHGLKICAVQRRAKYLLLDFGNGTLIIHLGMSGSLRILTSDHDNLMVNPQKHDHFDLVLDNQVVLRLRDPRRFGAILWQPADGLPHPLLVNLGPEPLTDDFNARYLFDKTRGCHTNIKQILMNSHVVVGVGNIYANESLFAAGISPRSAANAIGLKRYEKLVTAVKQTLQLAIASGGSSLRDFVHSDGSSGYFQQQYWVYGRAGERCRRCAGEIKQIKQCQRSSFYCTDCQH